MHKDQESKWCYAVASGAEACKKAHLDKVSGAVEELESNTLRVRIDQDAAIRIGVVEGCCDGHKGVQAGHAGRACSGIQGLRSMHAQAGPGE